MDSDEYETKAMTVFNDAASARIYLLEKGWQEVRGVFEPPSPSHIVSFFEASALDVLYPDDEI